MINVNDIQTIIANIMAIAAVLAVISAAITYGFTEFAKKVGMASRWAGIFSYVVAFGVSFLLAGLASRMVNGDFFTIFNFLVAGFATFLPAGAYSGIKAVASKPQA